MKQTFDTKSFATAIKTKRVIELNVGLREVGKKLKISHATIARAENGNVKTSINNVFKICSWLNKPLSDFIITKK